MKNSVLILLVFSFVTISSFVTAQDKITYTLYAEKDTIIQGELIYLYLVVNGIDKLINKDYRLTNYDSKEKYFFQIGPLELGTHVYGPYKIKLNNKKLISNKITVEVIEKKYYKNELIVSVPDTIYQDTIIEFQLKNNKEYIRLKLKQNESFQVISTSSSSQINLNEGVEFKEFSQTFKLKFTKPGVFVVSKDLFEYAIEDFQIKEKKVFILNTETAD